jgi:hypothetical protein
MDNPAPWVVDPSNLSAQKVSINLKNASLQGITAFQIIVHGRPIGGGDVVESLNLDSKVGAMQDSSLDVLVPGLSPFVICS